MLEDVDKKLDLIHNKLEEIKKELRELGVVANYLKVRNEKNYKLESIKLDLAEINDKFLDYKYDYEFNTSEPPLDTVVDDPYDDSYELSFEDTSTCGAFSCCGWVKRKK